MGYQLRTDGPYDSNQSLGKEKKRKREENHKNWNRIIFGGGIMFDIASIFAIFFSLFPRAPANKWKEESSADPRRRPGATLTRQAGKIRSPTDFHRPLFLSGEAISARLDTRLHHCRKQFQLTKEATSFPVFPFFLRACRGLRKDGKDRRDPLVPHSTPWR